MNTNFCIAIFSVLIYKIIKKSKLIVNRCWFNFDIQKKINKTNSVSGLVSTFFFFGRQKGPLGMQCARIACYSACQPHEYNVVEWKNKKIYKKGTYYNCMLSFSDIFRSLNSWKFSPTYCKKVVEEFPQVKV